MIIEFAKRELDIIGMGEDSEDEMNREMRKNILSMLEVFVSQGHSGFSAGYITEMLTKLMRYEPLSPLTGEDSEWTDVSNYGKEPWYQNKRYSSVFKDADGSCYDIDGIVFYRWEKIEDTGEDYKSFFTCSKSRVPVTFPYKPNKEYREWKENDN